MLKIAQPNCGVTVSSAECLASDNSKCQAKVVAHGKKLLTRDLLEFRLF